jgi:hypothetical protein
MKTNSPTILALGLLCTAVLPATGQNRNTVPLFNVNPGAGCTEVTASGDYAYVARGSAGIEVVQIAGAGAPLRVGTIRPYLGQGNICITDVQVVGNTLYASNDVPNGGPVPHSGFFIFDLATSPVAPAMSGTITWGAGPLYHLAGSVHNFCVDVVAGRSYAYMASAISNEVVVFDVTNPAVPEFKDQLRTPPASPGFSRGSVHDVAVKSGKCVSTWANGGFVIHDVSNIAGSYLDMQAMQFVSAVTLINYTTYPNALVYHAAFSADGNTLLTVDGRYYNGCRSWDLSSITTPMVPLVQTGSFTSGTTAFMHNIHVDGKYVYLSNFMDGCRIVELQPGGQLREMGRYDTTPTVGGSGSNGVWGVFVAGQKVLLGDTALGLVAVDFKDTISIPLAEWKQSTRTLTVQCTSTAAPAVGLSVNGYGPMNWNMNSGRYELVLGQVNSNPLSVTVLSDIGGQQVAPVRRR